MRSRGGGACSNIWWDLNNMRPSSTTSSSSSSSSPLLVSTFNTLQPAPTWHDHDNQQLPESLSHILMGGLVANDERFNYTQLLHLVDAKSDQLASEEKSCWGTQIILPTSSPSSCVTTSFNNSMLDFSNNKAETKHHSPECNSIPTAGSPYKKARVQPSSSSQSNFKVRKEKLGDRITTLHQLVSPFGKTDTASVLLEAIGYIRFLQSQVQALTSPYLATGSGNTNNNIVQVERSNIFPEDPGQLLDNNNRKKRRVQVNQDDIVDEERNDLKSRGLCLIPLSLTTHVGNDNAADYWAPNFGGGFDPITKFI